MKYRAQRWPSAWALAVDTPSGRVAVQVRNVSESGLLYRGDLGCQPGTRVAVEVLHQALPADVTRLTGQGGALGFVQPVSAVQLGVLRQYRDAVPGMG
ncbi:hypothetical protein [Pseudoponticoccus marisrubri]|uniref:PilZ domain-containing protein n=1 Tax=Pseudoponticoccus marisrubri TaxID=1685382 RepID=A0A0W7WGN6_9RHOB|nr:hypothetical protein [Pseudoponticoccus marisrubri]KUF09757.1 hypothetical protein AVJ23_16535 [Pseudoponticoccus marisrubri]